MFGRKRRERAAVAERARKDLAYEQWVTEKKLLWEENKDIYRQEWEKVNQPQVIVVSYGSTRVEILGHSWSLPGRGRDSYQIYRRVYEGDYLSTSGFAQKMVASFLAQDVYGIYFKDALVTSTHDEPTATT